MSVVVVGLSCASAPVALLERAAVGTDRLPEVLRQLASSPHVGEAMLLSTCNRVEVYADVHAFHAGVGELTAGLAASAGVSVDELGPRVYVHFQDAVVQHLFDVVCGLDSMVVGEAQILGQVRDALALGQDQGTVGRALNDLVQQALRVGKRAHAETGIDAAAPAIVSTGLELAAQTLGGLSGRRALLVGAGSLAALSAAALARAGLDEIVIANRSAERAESLAASLPVARAVGLEALEPELGQADLLVSCTGATNRVVSAEALARARGDAARPLAVLDLALPRDVDPAVADLPGVALSALDDLGPLLAGRRAGREIEAVRAIVAEEVAAYLAQLQAARVAPTVVALRARADAVIRAELDRFDSRAQTDDTTRAEIEHTVRRVVDKLLHAPTVRVKELAVEPDGIAYAEALHALFDLDPVRYREVVVADVHTLEVDEAEPDELDGAGDVGPAGDVGRGVRP
jgi:glutamyl-tRNA reductase